MRWMIFSLGAVGALVVLVGCDGSSGGRSAPALIGDFCRETGSEFCQRVSECGIGSYSSCHSAFVKSCCYEKNACNNLVKDGITDAEYDRCLSALRHVSCLGCLWRSAASRMPEHVRRHVGDPLTKRLQVLSSSRSSGGV